MNAKTEHFRVGDSYTEVTPDGSWLYWIDSILDNGELDLVGSFVPVQA